MAGKSQIRFGVGFDVDRSGLEIAQRELAKIANLTNSAFNGIQTSEGLSKMHISIEEVKTSAMTLQTALEQAYNPKLNTYNIETFNRVIQQSGYTIEELRNNMAAAGTQGNTAFRTMAGQLMTTNIQLRQTETLLDKMAKTLGNTIRWQLASGAVRALTGSVQEAFGYIKSLDASLNDIQIVTQKSADSMDDFAKRANKAAQSLGVATTDYTNAALLFYQQGLSDEEVEVRTNLTTKVANASGLSTSDASEYVTAVLNGYKVAADESEKAMDILAKVGATTASSLAELAEGMSKVASAANSMGVSEEQLAAIESTVISATRQDAANVGTAYKTIFARISDIKAGSEEAEVSLGNYTGKMAEMGFNVLDATGNLRDLGEVIEEIGYGWQDLTREQQVSLAQTMAGTRQYNNLIALFDNWDQYVNTLHVANDAQGTLNQQNETYLESTEAHLNILKAAKEDLFDSLIDNGVINDFADGMTKVLKFTTNWVDALGGGAGVLQNLGAIALTVFNKQIATGLNNMISRLTMAREQAQLVANQLEANGKIAGSDKVLSQTRADIEKVYTNKYMSTQDQQASLELIQTKNYWMAVAEAIDQTRQKAQEYGLDIANLNDAQLEEQQEDWVNTTDLIEVAIGELSDLQSAYLQMGASETAYSNTTLLEESIATDRALVSTLESRIQTLGAAGRNTLALEREREQALQRIYNNQLKLNSAQSEGDETVTAHLARTVSAAQTLAQAMGDSSPAAQKLQDIISGIATKTELSKDDVNDFIIALKNAANEASGEAKVKLEALGNALSHKFEEANINIDATQVKIKQLADTSSLTQLLSGFTGLFSVLTGLSGLINNLSHLSDIWNDDELSGGEKAVQIMQALGSAGMMLTMVFSSASKVINGFSVQTLNALGIKLGLITGEATLTGASLWAAFAPVIVPIVGVTAALGGLAIAIHLATDAWNHDADAAERAAQSADDAKNAYAEASQAASELKATLTDYRSAIDSLDDVAKSGGDVATALEDANAKARELIDTYNLFGKWTFGSNGEILIDQGALDEIQAQADKIANELNKDRYSALLNSTTANQVNTTTQFARSHALQYSPFTSGVITNEQELANGLNTLTLSNSEVEKLGKVIGEAINSGTNIYKAMGAAGISDAQQQLVRDREADWLEYAETISTLDDASVAYAKALLDINLPNELQNTAEILANGNTGLQAVITNILTRLWEGEEAPEGMAQDMAMMNRAGWDTQVGSWDAQNNTQAAIINWLNNYLDLGNSEEIAQQKLDELSQKVFGQIIEFGMGDTSSQIAQAYLSSKGYTDITTQDKSGKITGHYTDVNGVQEFSYTNAELGELYARAIATEAIIERWKEKTNNEDPQVVENLLSQLAESDSEFANPILTWLQNSDTELDLASVVGTFDKEDFESLKDPSLSNASFLELLGLNTDVTEEEFQTLFGSTIGEFKSQFQNALGEFNFDAYRSTQNAQGIARAEELGFKPEEFEQYRDYLQSINEALAENPALLNKVAIANMRLSRGVDDLAKNYDSWREILSDITKQESQEYSKALQGVQADLADVLDVTQEQIEALGEQWPLDNWDAIQNAATGDKAAIEELQKQLADAVATQYLVDIGVNTSAIEALQAELLNDPILGEYEIGVAINNDDFIARCNEIIETAGMTADQASEYFKALGYDVVLDKKIITTRRTGTRTVFNGDTAEVKRFVDVTKEEVPVVKSITKNGSYGGGGRSYGGSGTSGASSGGGGGSSKTKEKKSDPYHDIDIELANIKSEFDDLAKAQDKLMGQDLIDNLNAQLGILEKQIAAEKTKLAIAKQVQADQRKTLEEYGARFNEDGNLANYFDLLGNASGDDVDAIEDAIKEYEDTTKLIQELGDTIDDLADKEIEINISKFKTAVEIHLDLKDAAKEWNEFKHKVLLDDDDTNLGAATQAEEDLRDYFLNAMGGQGSVQALTQQVNDTLAQLRQMDETGASDVYGTNRTQAMEDLQHYYQELMKSLEDIKELEDDVEKQFLSSIDAVKDAYSAQKDLYDFADKQIQHQLKMVGMLYGDKAYAQMAKYYAEAVKQSETQITSLKEQAAYWQAQMDAARGAGDEEAYKKYEENWKNAISNLESEFDTLAQRLSDKLGNAVDDALETMTQTLAGHSLDYLEEEWDLVNMNAETYLDNINSAYEKQNLQNKWIDAINGTSSVSAQKKLNAAMAQQMKYLEEKGKLTQYDIERAEKEYEIALKQIALQEQQANKSKMRLRRDANGNYTYQFVADDEQINKAQEELAAAQNDLYNFDKKQANSVKKDFLSTYTDMQNKLDKIAKNTKLSEQEKEDERELVMQEYSQKLLDLANENGFIMNNLAESAYNALHEYFDPASGKIPTDWNAMTEAQKQAWLGDTGLIPELSTGVGQLVDKITDDPDSLVKALDDAETAIGDALGAYQLGLQEIADEVKNLEATVNAELPLMEEPVQKAIDDTKAERDMVAAVVEQVKELVKQFQNAVDAASQSAVEGYNYWNSYESNATTALDHVQSKINEVTSAAKNMATTLAAASSASGSSTNNSFSLGGDWGLDSTSNLATGNEILKVMGNIGYEGNHNDSDARGGVAGTVVGYRVRYQIMPDGKTIYAVEEKTIDGGQTWILVTKKKVSTQGSYTSKFDNMKVAFFSNGYSKAYPWTGSLDSYDTGGYTGSWDSSGRLAMLHQKELVLNQADTSNILAVVDSVRSIVNSMGMSINTPISSSGISSVSDALQQQVYITANFEGKTEADQISAALNNLMNVASQRANRNIR